MDTTYLLLLFGTACFATWVFLLLFITIYTDQKRLKKSGHPEGYISFLRKDYQKRSLGIAIGVPLLLLAAYSIYWLLFGVPIAYNSLFYIFLIFLILVAPFPILDIKKSRKEYRKIAIETDAPIVVDLKYKVLHKFFNPLMEFAFVVLFLFYYFSVKDAISPIVFIHLAIPWLIYLSARNSKFLTKPMMKEGYYMLFAIISLNYVIVMIYVFRYGIQCVECLTQSQRLFSIGIFFILLVKLTISSYNFIHTRKFYSP